MKILRYIIIFISSILLGAAVATFIFIFKSEQEEPTRSIPVEDMAEETAEEYNYEDDELEDFTEQLDTMLTEYADDEIPVDSEDNEYIPEDQIPTDLFGPEGLDIGEGVYFDSEGIFHAPEGFVDASEHEGWIPIQEYVFWKYNPEFDNDLTRNIIKDAIDQYYNNEDVGDMYVDFYTSFEVGSFSCWVYVPSKRDMLYASYTWGTDSASVSLINE